MVWLPSCGSISWRIGCAVWHCTPPGSGGEVTANLSLLTWFARCPGPEDFQMMILPASKDAVSPSFLVHTPVHGALAVLKHFALSLTIILPRFLIIPANGIVDRAFTILYNMQDLSLSSVRHKTVTRYCYHQTRVMCTYSEFESTH